ncbi:unnamed protein product, partial [marine sediment metagenome]
MIFALVNKYIVVLEKAIFNEKNNVPYKRNLSNLP